jgi:DNA-binding response OmpR family regulator
MFNLTSQSSKTVLLVNTDDSFAQRASIDLKNAGYIAIVAIQLSGAREQFKQMQPGMVVLDYSLTGESGLEFCRQLRSKGHRIPILILVNNGTIDERVACLESGADDYLVKPYHSENFLKLLNLYLQSDSKVKEQLRYSNLVLDLSSRRLLRNEQSIDLTMKEFELLKYMMSHPEEVLTREQILENVWGYDFQGESNVIEVYIRYLRLKLEQEGNKRLINTIRGVGYVLKES